MSVSRYFRQLEAARDVALGLTADQEQEFLELLREYAEEIAARVSAGLTSATRVQVLAEVELLLDELTRDMAISTGRHIHLTAERLAEAHARATLALLSSAGSNIAAAPLFSGVAARSAQAILARPELSQAFVTIRRESVAAADQIIKRGVLRGAPSSAISRELRQHIVGTGSLLEGDATLLADRRKISYAAIQELGYEPTPENLAMVRKEAGQIAAKAQRIARTEIMNTEREVATQAAIVSPVVEFVEIRLSYRHTVKCACEPIVQADLYGHGEGRYDPRNVPVRPHPNCWCAHRNILLPVGRWGEARGPVPELRADLADVAKIFELTPSQQSAFEAAINAGQRGRAARREAA